MQESSGSYGVSISKMPTGGVYFVCVCVCRKWGFYKEKSNQQKILVSLFCRILTTKIVASDFSVRTNRLPDATCDPKCTHAKAVRPKPKLRVRQNCNRVALHCFDTFRLSCLGNFLLLSIAKVRSHRNDTRRPVSLLADAVRSSRPRSCINSKIIPSRNICSELRIQNFLRDPFEDNRNWTGPQRCNQQIIII